MNRAPKAVVGALQVLNKFAASGQYSKSLGKHLANATMTLSLMFNENVEETFTTIEDTLKDMRNA